MPIVGVSAHEIPHYRIAPNIMDYIKNAVNSGHIQLLSSQTPTSGSPVPNLTKESILLQEAFKSIAFNLAE